MHIRAGEVIVPLWRQSLSIEYPDLKMMLSLVIIIFPSKEIGNGTQLEIRK